MKGLLIATSLAIRGATLIDATGAAARPNSLIVISGERIVSVGVATPEALAALPAATTVLDAAGKWILAGLIDAHVHAESDEDLKTMLRWGVTSVRLMAEDVAAAGMLAASARGRNDVPDVFPAAPIFAAKGGWWDQGEPPDAHLDRFPDTPERARASVRRAKTLGSAEIKIMLDDMGWCRDPLARLPRMTPEVAKSLIEEARRAGLRVIVHAPNPSDAKEAVTRGATALAHGVLGPFDEWTVGVMRTRPVFYVPTMDIFEFLADTHAFIEAVFSDPRAEGGLPPGVVKRYRSREYADGYARRYPNFRNIRERLPALRENLARLHATGVPVALGTDMWAFPGLGVSIEMDLYVKAGLSPLEAIRAATETAARSLGQEKNRGTLEPGKRADLLLLDADPLKDVKNVRAISAIYKAGRRVPFDHPITRSPDRPISQ